MSLPYAGELAALATAACWSLTALAFASAGRRVGSLPVNLIRLLMGFGFLCVAGLLRRGLLLPTDATPRSVWILSLSGLLGFTFGDLCLFRAFIVLGPRLSTLVMTLSPPITALVGYILLGEVLAPAHGAGMALIMGGIALAVLEHREPDPAERHPAEGLLLAFGGALGQALGLVASKIGMGSYDAMAATQIRVVAGALGFVAVFTLSSRWSGVLAAVRDGRAMGFTAVGAFFGPFLGVSLSLLSLQLTAAGVAATLMNTTPIMILPFAMAFGRERISMRALAAAVLAVGGVALMFLGGGPPPPR